MPIVAASFQLAVIGSGKLKTCRHKAFAAFPNCGGKFSTCRDRVRQVENLPPQSRYLPLNRADNTLSSCIGAPFAYAAGNGNPLFSLREIGNMNRSRFPSLSRLALLLLAGIGLCLADVGGQQPAKDKDKGEPAAVGKAVGGLPDNVVKSFTWRCVGPANMAGRITAIAVDGADPSCYWVATAGGGLVKTTNNGTTFEHQFDKEATVSIGDVCVAPSNRNIVWVGTGEANPRNSVSYGDGVYKSTDGGKTWKNMGLKESFQIGQDPHPSQEPRHRLRGRGGTLLWTQ